MTEISKVRRIARPAMIPRRRTDLIAREVDGEALILDRAAGKVHQLNATAAFIWDHCDGASSMEEMVSWLASAYGVDSDVARRDAAKTVDALEKLGLLAEGDTAGGDKTAAMDS